MYRSLEEGLGYIFENRKLLENALTHSSYANENRERRLPDNERLEFLGDSILGFVVADYLYRRFPEKPEGNSREFARTSSARRTLPRRPGRFIWAISSCSATEKTTAAAESATRSCLTRWSPSLRQATWTAALRRRRESSTG